LKGSEEVDYLKLIVILLAQILISISGGLFISRRMTFDSLAGSMFGTFAVMAVILLVSGFILFSLFII